MIKFISKKLHKVLPVEGELIISDSISPEDVTQIKSLNITGFDLETNSLDPFSGSILLMIIGNKELQYVIDATTIDCEQLLLNIINDPDYELKIQLNNRRYDKLIIGANIKFDYKFIKVKYDITFTRMFDVMIAEQRLLQGMDEFSYKFNKRVQLSSALDKIVLRRLGVVPSGMNKAVRNEFIGVNPNIFEFENKHIFYAADDISQLFDIREIQKKEIEKYGLGFLIYNIEFPLIRVLADAELRGFNVHEDKWKDNIVRNKDLKFNTEIELDEELKRLRNSLLPVNERLALSNGRFDRKRIKQDTTPVENLFGDMFNEIEINPVAKSKKKGKIENPYINYSSSDQIVHIFGRLKQPCPTKDGVYITPTFTTKKGKIVIDKSSFSFTTNAKAIETYKIENPHLPIINFVTKLIAFRTYVTRINTFGEEFLNKYKNRITKRFHTVYRQCHAVTGRLQSGDEDNGYYNSQNIPREKEYREPFYDNNNDIITTDLSGAEAVIMIDKARDEKFYQLAIVNDDAHSPLCQAVWRAIGKFRLSKYNFTDWVDEAPNNYQEALKLSQIVITKKENKDMRTAYKPMTFGDIYGMGIKKRAKTLGVSEEESKIAGIVQKSMLPKTYKMVANNAVFAVQNGYIILNNRTNSRMWFTEILEARKNHSDISNETKYNVESSAKNSPIQGTQADMVKEIMVEIHKEAERQNMYKLYDFALLGQVHDETIYSCKNANQIVEFVKDDKSIELVTIAEFIKKWHIQVCNRYLSFITMSAEQKIAKTWIK